MRIRRPSPALIVAVLALAVAMSGTAVAAVALKSGDSLIAKRTLSGNRLRTNTVTGREINEASLGTVPHARTASALPPLTWHRFTLNPGWVDYFSSTSRPASWAIDAQGIVHLRGSVYRDSGSESAFAPTPKQILTAQPVYVAVDAVNAAPARVIIEPAGMYLQDLNDGRDVDAFTSLDGVTYSLK